MTKEQEETIDRLNSFKTIKILYGNTFAIHLEQLEQLQKDMATVLDLVKQQQEESEKKDKIIDEMAEWIFDKDYNENSLFIDRDDYYSNCIKRVKQYFEKKVREE